MIVMNDRVDLHVLYFAVGFVWGILSVGLYT